MISITLAHNNSKKITQIETLTTVLIRKELDDLPVTMH